MNKADYSKIAEYYDKGRTASGPVIDLWTGLVSKYIDRSREIKLLDIGCGTGRFTLPIANRFQCRVTGTDMSIEMLAKAKDKDKNGVVQWDVQDIHDMTYDDETFEAVFISNVIHHCNSPIKALKECFRILADSGVILIRYGSMDQIREDVTHTLFPETLIIDEGRTPSIEILEQWLVESGFYGVNTEEVEQKTFQTGTDLLEAYAIKSSSVLGMISEDAFANGMQKLTKYVEENPDDPWLFYDRFALTTGYKGGR